MVQHELAMGTATPHGDWRKGWQQQQQQQHRYRPKSKQQQRCWHWHQRRRWQRIVDVRTSSQPAGVTARRRDACIHIRRLRQQPVSRDDQANGTVCECVCARCVRAMCACVGAFAFFVIMFLTPFFIFLSCIDYAAWRRCGKRPSGFHFSHWRHLLRRRPYRYRQQSTVL